MPRRLTLFFQHLAKEPFSSSLVPTSGHRNVQNITILIHCSPEVDLPALNPHEQFINVPNIAQPTLLLSNRLGVLGAEFEAPATNSLMGNQDATFGQQMLDISQTEGEMVVKPYGVTSVQS